MEDMGEIEVSAEDRLSGSVELVGFHGKVVVIVVTHAYTSQDEGP